MVKKILKKVLSFTLALCLLMNLMPAHVKAAGSGEPTVGQICLFPYYFVPIGYLECSGQELSISSYPALFSLLGNTFGGNGITTFALPNLTSANPYSSQNNNGYTAKYYIATEGLMGSWAVPVIGEVCLLPDSVVNKYAQNYGEEWLKCDGSSYDTTTYNALYSIIATKFGTKLPDLSHSSPLTGLSYYIACKGNYPSSSFALEDFIGAINLAAINFVPTDMVPCNGQILPIAQNTALYALLGTSYGGNGTTTFAVPDLRGLAPLPGLTYYISTMGYFPSRY